MPGKPPPLALPLKIIVPENRTRMTPVKYFEDKATNHDCPTNLRHCYMLPLAVGAWSVKAEAESRPGALSSNTWKFFISAISSTIVRLLQIEAVPVSRDPDIVAVHGLGGGAVSTWTHSRSKAFWLKEFLPQQIPDARVMTYDYNAAMVFGSSSAQVIDHARGLLATLLDKREESEEIRRPLIFIAHSLGGIVVKAALLQARLDPRYEAIENATLGIIFLGTPHRGSDKATYGKALANVANALVRRPPPHLLNALQTNSDTLEQFTNNFRFQLGQYQIYSFYEQRVMAPFATLIVERTSALLQTDHEEQIPVDNDHSSMCKFETNEDPTLEKVCRRINRMKNGPRRTTCNQSATSPHNQYFEVPVVLSPTFTGREIDLQRLTTSFAVGPIFQREHQRRFVLFGLGGSGKTQLCLKYIQDQRERYWGIFWIDASTKESIQQSFAQIARVLQVEETIDDVKRKLANASQAWLLVMDNADDPQIHLTPYFPAGNRGNIIITSRNPHCQSYNTAGSSEVDKLSCSDSLELFRRTLNETMENPPCNVLEAHQIIVERLGYLPLAIVQAGAYIRETSCTFDEYLKMYERRKQDLLGYLPQHGNTDYRFSVYTTWEVSVDKIKSIDDKRSNQALRLLNLLGFYHYVQIPLQMLYRSRTRPDSAGSLDHLPWIEDVADSMDFQHAVRNSISLLASFSLVTSNADASISLHPLVHEWCRDRLHDGEERQAEYQNAMLLLISSNSWGESSEDYTYRRSLLSHIQELLQLQSERDMMSEDHKINCWPVMANILGENGRSRDAIPLREGIIELLVKRDGEEDENVVRLLHDLGVDLNKVGRIDEALKIREKVLKVRRETLGEAHPDTLSSLQSLAVSYDQKGRLDDALKIREKVVKLRRETLGEAHPDTLSSLQNLAVSYNQKGRLDDALQIEEKVVELRRETLGEAHPDTLDSLHNLAVSYKKGRLDDALEIEEKVVELRQETLGEAHPDTLDSLFNLAVSYDQKGRLDDALRIEEKVVELRRETLGEAHPDTLDSLHNLAVSYDQKGRLDEALELAEKVVELRRETLGEAHPDTLESLILLAWLYRTERPNEALELAEKVVKLRRETLGDAHPDTQRAERLLNRLLKEQQKNLLTPQSPSEPQASENILHSPQMPSQNTSLALEPLSRSRSSKSGFLRRLGFKKDKHR